MGPPFHTLLADARRAEAFFAALGYTGELPFVHSYPKGSCEIVSALLAVALQQKYQEAMVQVAMGYNHQLNKWHFWVEVGETVVDATAHQFPEYRGPLVTPRPSALEREYPDVERITPLAAIERFPKIDPAAVQCAVNALVGSDAA